LEPCFLTQGSLLEKGDVMHKCICVLSLFIVVLNSCRELSVNTSNNIASTNWQLLRVNYEDINGKIISTTDYTDRICPWYVSFMADSLFFYETKFNQSQHEKGNTEGCYFTLSKEYKMIESSILVITDTKDTCDISISNDTLIMRYRKAIESISKGKYFAEHIYKKHSQPIAPAESICVCF